MLGWLMMAMLGTQLSWAGRPSPEAIEARRAEREGSLAVGDTAPTGPLVTLEGEPANLQQFLGDRPIVLIFGSFTWPPFRRSVERLQKLHADFGDKATFVTVYIQEAHASDEKQVPENLEGADGVCYSQPRNLEDRRLIAKDFSERFTYGVPLYVDLMDNALMKAYAAWPERLYVIEGGKVVHKGAPGPKGFDPEGVQAWLEAYVAR